MGNHKMNSANYSKYVVTGKDVYGKRFIRVYDNPYWAFGINLRSGSVWGVSVQTGKRVLLKRV